MAHKLIFGQLFEAYKNYEALNNNLHHPNVILKKGLIAIAVLHWYYANGYPNNF